VQDMRTVDACPVPAALDLGDAIDGIATYDARLAAAASAHGLAVAAPGA
jgi:hypothetical protein